MDVHFRHIEDLVQEFKPKRVLIDSLSTYGSTLGSQGRIFRDFFHALIALMKEEQIAAVYNHENPEMFGMASMMGEFGMSSLVDNIILMNWVELGDAFRLGLTIAKMRANPVDRVTHECEIVNGRGCASCRERFRRPISRSRHMPALFRARRRATFGNRKEFRLATRASNSGCYTSGTDELENFEGSLTVLEDLEFAAVERWLAMLGIQTLAEWDLLMFLTRHRFSLFRTDTIPSLAGYSSELSDVALSSLERLQLVKRIRTHANQDIYTPATPDEPTRKTALNHLMDLVEDRTVRLVLIGRPAKPTRPLPSTRPRPLVVGLCGSAGALEPLSEIFSQLSLDTGMAFVVVQHMSASRASLLPAILSRVTAMPVAQIEEDMSIQPNRVFVIPPNTDLTTKGGLLHLADRTLDQFHRHRSIDTFLISLANDRRSAAISVILSGLDNDGIMGTAAIKKGGGITMAQRVDTASEPALPGNVITDGLVDFVESPQGIAQLLVQFSRE